MSAFISQLFFETCSQRTIYLPESDITISPSFFTFNEYLPTSVTNSSLPYIFIVVKAKSVAPTDISILVVGESGTVKESIPKRTKPIAKTECANRPSKASSGRLVLLCK